ncbi:MAG: ATP-binding cassette domain-containing protein [Sulfuricaulis sp.]|uniref:ATP-binding cassette domain-containing protein n=1 Tax=Sulfuricaulis sp. TaxID=2003553 RepID=UPI0034A2FC39
MISFDHVTEGPMRDLSFDLVAGTRAKAIYDSDERRNVFFSVITGLRRPAKGSVIWDGQDIYALEESERLTLFERSGVVPADGGLISNLKAWENLMLPAWYHRGVTAPQAERKVVDLFRQLGMTEAGLRRQMGQLPDQLTMYEKRAVALVRAMLMEPDILIYDSLFTGLDRESSDQIMSVTGEYHGKKPGRISLYLCADDAVSARLTTDQTITLTH